MGDGTQEFGGLLRSRRRKSGLSQLELAERSGLSTRAISKLECGLTRWPYPDSVGRLADALGLRDTERAEFTAAARRRLGLRAVPARRRTDPGYVPRLLPAPIPAFTGRAGESVALSRMLDEPAGTVPVTAITGTAGAGKTALAVSWAHRAAARFPDGQLFLDLHGFGPSGGPLAPEEAARVFLDALQVPADRLPATAEAQLGLFRSLLAGKRMLVVLDNAHNAAQVRPLLPGGRECRVVVTSRDRLAGLTVTDGARPLAVGALTDSEARHLLAGRLGAARLAADPLATDRIVASCAGLPLALCIAATRIQLRPDLPLARIAADLAAAPRLDAFTDTSDPAADLRTAFSWSYRQLDGDAALTFRLAGLHPDLGLEPGTIAALTGTTLELAGRALDALARASLIHVAGQERYTMNRLLRAYAGEQAARHEDERFRTALTA
jgi:transcriptional regulator with XRE-family HTH domain